jgi:hypothetical protein
MMMKANRSRKDEPFVQEMQEANRGMSPAAALIKARHAGSN